MSRRCWRVPRPLDRVIDTMGWLWPQAKYREFGGSFIYPMGDDMVSIGMVVGLDYRDPRLNPHDLLQILKTDSSAPSSRVANGSSGGAKTIPGGGFHALPLTAPRAGLLMCGDGVGMVNVPTLKGVHYVVESGRLAAEAAFAAVSETADDGSAPDAASRRTTTRCAPASSGTSLHQMRDLRQVFGRGFFLGGALGVVNTITKGRVSIGSMTSEPDDEPPLLPVDRPRRPTYHDHDGRSPSTSCRRCSPPGNKTRDDQPNHVFVGTPSRLTSRSCG